MQERPAISLRTPDAGAVAGVADGERARAREGRIGIGSKPGSRISARLCAWRRSSGATSSWGQAVANRGPCRAIRVRFRPGCLQRRGGTPPSRTIRVVLNRAQEVRDDFTSTPVWPEFECRVDRWDSGIPPPGKRPPDCGTELASFVAHEQCARAVSGLRPGAGRPRTPSANPPLDPSPGPVGAE